MIDKFFRLLFLLVLIIVFIEFVYLVLLKNSNSLFSSFLNRKDGANKVIFVGKDFVGLTKKDVLKIISQPSNKNKIILPGKPNDKSLVVYPSLQPYRSSGISYTPLSLLITETDDSNIIIPTANRTFGVSKTNKGNGIIAIDDFNGKKLKVDGLGEIEIANVMVFFGVDPQHSFNYETFDLSKFGFGDPIYQHSVPYQWFQADLNIPKASVNIRIIVKGKKNLTKTQIDGLFRSVFLLEKNKYVFIY